MASWFESAMGEYGVEALAEELGVAGSYVSPAGGDAVACVVVWGPTRREHRGDFDGEYSRVAGVAQLRLSEIAAPARGGVLTIDGVAYALDVERERAAGTGLALWECVRLDLESSGGGAVHARE